MASMSGVALPSAPQGPRPQDPAPEDQLFTGLVVSNPPPVARTLGLPASLLAHAIGIALLILLPIYWPSPLPEHPDYIRAIIYDPPPAAAAPLPKGMPNVNRNQPPKPTTPETRPEKPKLTADIEVPREVPLKPEARTPETDNFGSLTGSDSGIPEGMEGGVEGGVPGGIPGGVVGGCVGCTGTGPVLDYDLPPRPLKQPLQYPQEAFVKKIEGTVRVEAMIDASGRVIPLRIVRSAVPILDRAAFESVKQWVFSPALRRGQPVAIVAHLDVTFRIY
jgi:protein TonB